MNALQRKPSKPYDLLRQFAIYYIGFSLVPYALLFYLYVVYSRGPHHAGLPKKELGEALILLSVVCLTV